MYNLKYNLQAATQRSCTIFLSYVWHDENAQTMQEVTAAKWKAARFVASFTIHFFVSECLLAAGIYDYIWTIFLSYSCVKVPKWQSQGFHECASVIPWILVCVKFGLLFWEKSNGWRHFEYKIRISYG